MVSGKGQILTTYRGPSSREREGGGGTHPGKRGKPQPNQGGVVGQWHDLPPWRKAAAATTGEGGGEYVFTQGPQNGHQECRATPGELGGREWGRAAMKHMAKAADTTDRVYTTRRLQEEMGGGREGGQERKGNARKQTTDG